MLNQPNNPNSRKAIPVPTERWLPVETLVAEPVYDFLVRVRVADGVTIGLQCSLPGLEFWVEGPYTLGQVEVSRLGASKTSIVSFQNPCWMDPITFRGLVKSCEGQQHKLADDVEGLLVTSVEEAWFWGLWRLRV